MWCFVLYLLSCLSLQAAQPMVIEISEYEKQLYLTPGGMYTREDIQANGNMTRSQKFIGLAVKHDPNATSGDAICPITSVKANPDCTWVIGGKSYQFCCPQCIDEFLNRAKLSTAEIKNPEFYTK
jgi:hypothetical protein